MRNANILIGARRAAVGALVVGLTTVCGLLATAGPASAASFFSFNAGVFDRHQVKHVWWNNANTDAYAPGLQATPSEDPQGSCDIEVTRSWYQRNASGEREFHLEIKGDSSYKCQVTVWLARLSMFRESSTGALAPGQSKSWIWNNAHSGQNVYVVGALPAQPASGACEIEVTTQYRTQPDGENEFLYRAKNVGSVACSAQLRHVALPVASTLNMIPVAPGGNITIYPSILPSGAKVVVPGGAPAAVAAGVCQYSVGTVSYVGLGDIHAGYLNSGAVTCALKATFAVL